MRTTHIVASACLCAFAVGPAFGADGLYISIEGGGSSVADWEHTRTKWTPCGPEKTEARASFDDGIAAFAAIGYALQGWRVELEGGYRQNNLGAYVKEYRMRDYAFDPGGELTEASLMASLIYDVHLFDRFSLAIGAGLGGDYGRFKLDSHWAPIDEGDIRFAYQGIAGLNYALTAATQIFVNYRFTDVSNVGFDPTEHLHLQGDDFEKQAATAGVRFALFAPAPAAQPAPPPVPAPAPPAVAVGHEFMVFFGFNQSSLTAEALATIKQVVGAVRESGSASIRVVGHADRAGSIAYNKALSLRRARSVKQALVLEGVSANGITMEGRGESDPLVPTADGVREPQNRRVHISF